MVGRARGIYVHFGVTNQAWVSTIENGCVFCVCVVELEMKMVEDEGGGKGTIKESHWLIFFIVV